MASPESVVSVTGVTYCAPEVHVAFVGIKGKESMVQTIAAPADEKNRSGRVAIIKTILEAIKCESEIGTAGWNAAYLEAKMKKLASKQRKAAK